jgi:hypothetical protein
MDSPVGSVYQGVTLQAGRHYALSWWDATLDADGEPHAESHLYMAAVYDEAWQLVAVRQVDSHASTGDWSERRIIDFQAPTEGTYYVLFQPSPTDTQASFAIANVQLQLAAPADGFATAYESIRDKRVVFTSNCGHEADAIQKAFEYRCESGTCFYELKAPFQIDVTEIESRSSSLTGLVGAGNYNHRFRDTAVNLVGSGVLDCSGNPTPGCFSMGYVEYDFVHDAYDVPMVDYGGQPRCFSFGTGAIRGGKALAAERYLTMPVSSSDEALISQAGFLRPELSGRPLSGIYRLRIYDNPALDWERVEDIQLVLGYRVWSRVTRTPGN